MGKYTGRERNNDNIKRLKHEEFNDMREYERVFQNERGTAQLIKNQIDQRQSKQVQLLKKVSEGPPKQKKFYKQQLGRKKKHHQKKKEKKNKLIKIKMSYSARSSFDSNIDINQIKSIAKKYSFDEQNQIHTSETCSSNNSPSNSCYSHGDQVQSVFNIEDYLISTNKNQMSLNDFSSAIVNNSSESSTMIEQMSLSQFKLNRLQSIFSNAQNDENTTESNIYTPATRKSSIKRPLARKSTFLEDEMHEQIEKIEKIEKKVKGNDNPLHEEVEFLTHDGSKSFKFNCFPERFLGIPSEFQDKNINQDSDNDQDSCDETILNACRYNLSKVKLELMEMSSTFRYSHHHVDFDKISSQYLKIRQRKDSESSTTSDKTEMTSQQQEEQQTNETSISNVNSSNQN